MKFIFLLIPFFIGFTFADVDLDSLYHKFTVDVPSGCKRKGNRIKCPVNYHAGVIYDIDKTMQYYYFPRSEGQTEMVSINKCKNIIPFPTERWYKYHKREDYTDGLEYIIDVIKSKEYKLFCADAVTRKEYFCQNDKKHVLIIKYDDLGIEDESLIIRTNNQRYCKEKFDKKFK